MRRARRLGERAGTSWRREHFDAATVLFTVCRTLPAELMPERRTVIRVEIRDRRRERLWLLLDGEQSEVCVKPPGDTDDPVVTTSSEWLTKWHVGRKLN